MKEMKLLNILFLFSLILYTINSSDESEIHYVIDATMNGTALPIELSSENDYVFFSYDIFLNIVNWFLKLKILHFLI